MKNKLNRSLKVFLLVALAVALFASPNSGQSARQAETRQSAADSTPDESAISYPTGAVAEFPVELDSPTVDRPPVAYIRSSEGGTDAKAWVLNADVSEQRGTAAPEARTAGPVVRKVVSFVVPQLPAGLYVAWYEVANRPGERLGSMRLHISPQLHTAIGLVRGNPGEETEVQVGVDTTFVAAKDGKEPEQKQFEVTLHTGDGGVVGLAPGQPATVRTGRDGYATWRVRLNKEGEAVLRATAPGFESSEIGVVSGPPPSSPEAKAAEQELEKAQKDAQDAEEEARSERASAELVENRVSMTQSAEAVIKTRDLERLAALREKAERNALRAEEKRSQALLRVSAAQARLAALAAAPPFSEQDLQPGDVLLILGDGYLSEKIRAVDGKQLGRGDYSHAAIYVGESGGRKMIVEMLNGGHTFHPLAVAMRDDRRVDVWRWGGGLSDFQRSRVVTTATYSLRGKKYAHAQLTVLGLAAVSPYGLGVEKLMNEVEDWSGGRRQLICSELVAYAYHEAGLDPSVTKWWDAIAKLVRGNDDREHDYTTPNMLAASGKFVFRGKLK
jgi:cell wall-associated NlpC family hydrolase